MKTVAKLVMIDPSDNYLLLHRGDHPTFGKDPDLPGGTLEEGESALETMLREVEEEAGVVVNGSRVQEVYSGTGYSMHGTHHALFMARLDTRPEIALSWEHSSYEWIPRNEFIEKAKHAKDAYMHMVSDVVASLASRA